MVSLLRFAKNEEPYPEDQSQPEQKSGFIQFWDKGEDKKEDDFPYLSIAQLYDAISKGFETIHERIGDNMFTMKPNMQTIKKPYTDVDSCLERYHYNTDTRRRCRRGKAVLRCYS